MSKVSADFNRVTFSSEGFNNWSPKYSSFCKLENIGDALVASIYFKHFNNTPLQLLDPDWPFSHPISEAIEDWADAEVPRSRRPSRIVRHFLRPYWR